MTSNSDDHARHEWMHVVHRTGDAVQVLERAVERTRAGAAGQQDRAVDVEQIEHPTQDTRRYRSTRNDSSATIRSADPGPALPRNASSVIGIGLSYGIGYLFALFVKQWEMVFSLGSIVTAFVCSTLIGIVFGFVPARNAARLDPIEALARD